MIELISLATNAAFVFVMFALGYIGLIYVYVTLWDKFKKE